MTLRALLALGVAQCVYWGALYYAFAGLLLPLEADLRAPRWLVAGAFSLALLVSALLAPWVGTRIDRGHGAQVMRLGGAGAAVALLAWAVWPSIVTLYVAWAVLGAAMAATLYEPAFAIVSRAIADPAARLRALAVITLCGGLASTVFLPLTGWLVAAAGWQAAVVVLALLVGGVTWLTEREVFRVGSPTQAARGTVPSPDAAGDTGSPVPLGAVLAVFAYIAFASAALIANLVPAMAERGIAPATAALLGGVFGLMQLPGRALVLHGALGGAPWLLLAASLALQACGLGAWAFGPSPLAVVVGLAVFALGAGLATLVRPFLLHELYGSSRIGRLNGQLARAQQLARAAGPVSAAVAGSIVGYGPVLVVFCCAFVLLAFGSLRRQRAVTAV